MSIDGEVVGLRDKTNGRQCKLHACCGDNIRPGSIVTFKLAMVFCHGKEEEAIKVVHVVDGKEACTVGFLPKIIFKNKKYHHLNKMARIILCYQDSPDKVISKRDYQNKGIASFKFIQDEINKNKLK